MNRRDFFKRLTIGGVATAVAVREFPFRVFSFPSEIKIPSTFVLNPAFDPAEVRVRFIRAFDLAQAKMLNRWDVLYGFMVLDEAHIGPFLENPDQFPYRLKIASPEEARKLGLVDSQYADALDDVARRHDNSEFESTAIARPEQFLDIRTLGDPEEA